MQLNPYLIFNGNCEAAFKFYEQVLGAKILMMMTHANSPMADTCPADHLNRIMHARLTIGENVIMASDCPEGRFEPQKGFFINLGFDDPKEADRIFHALSEGGNVIMPIAETFWAIRFGMLVDRFGTPWMVNCERVQGQP